MESCPKLSKAHFYLVSSSSETESEKIFLDILLRIQHTFSSYQQAKCGILMKCGRSSRLGAVVDFASSMLVIWRIMARYIQVWIQLSVTTAWSVNSGHTSTAVKLSRHYIYSILLVRPGGNGGGSYMILKRIKLYLFPSQHERALIERNGYFALGEYDKGTQKWWHSSFAFCGGIGSGFLNEIKGESRDIVTEM